MASARYATRCSQGVCKQRRRGLRLIPWRVILPPIHSSHVTGCLLTWVHLPALPGRRRLAMAVIPHGPVHLVKVTRPPTLLPILLLGAISLNRWVLRVVSVALVMKRLVGHECGRVHAHLCELSCSHTAKRRPLCTRRPRGEGHEQRHHKHRPHHGPSRRPGVALAQTKMELRLFGSLRKYLRS